LGQKCNRIEALRQRHAALDLEVQRLEQQPSSDSLSIAALKKEKLRLKEEIHSLEASLALEAPAITSLSLAAE